MFSDEKISNIRRHMIAISIVYYNLTIILYIKRRAADKKRHLKDIYDGEANIFTEHP